MKFFNILLLDIVNEEYNSTINIIKMSCLIDFQNYIGFAK